MTLARPDHATHCSCRSREPVKKASNRPPAQLEKDRSKRLALGRRESPRRLVHTLATPSITRAARRLNYGENHNFASSSRSKTERTVFRETQLLLPSTLIASMCSFNEYHLRATKSGDAYCLVAPGRNKMTESTSTVTQQKVLSWRAPAEATDYARTPTRPLRPKCVRLKSPTLGESDRPVPPNKTTTGINRTTSPAQITKSRPQGLCALAPAIHPRLPNIKQASIRKRARRRLCADYRLQGSNEQPRNRNSGVPSCHATESRREKSPHGASALATAQGPPSPQ